MITNVYSNSAFVTANSTVAGPYINAGTPSAGMLRYYNQQVQVYDGTSWWAIGSTVNVGMSAQAEEILNWARKKMEEEHEARAMALDAGCGRCLGCCARSRGTITNHCGIV